MANKSIKVTYKAFDQVHEDVFPENYTISQLANYLRNVCSTFVILDMNPTTRDSTINTKSE